MALRTYEEYLESLRKMKNNIYKFDELIEDVTTHPATRRTVEGHGTPYKFYKDEKIGPMVTTKSHLTGEPISRYLSIIREPEDMYANSEMKRLMFNLTGHLHRRSLRGLDCAQCHVHYYLGDGPRPEHRLPSAFSHMAQRRSDA